MLPRDVTSDQLLLSSLRELGVKRHFILDGIIAFVPVFERKGNRLQCFLNLVKNHKATVFRLKISRSSAGVNYQSSFAFSGIILIYPS